MLNKIKMNIEKKYFELKIIVEHLLEDGLSDNLFYHKISHTMKDVLSCATYLAKQEKLNEHDTYLLLIAVLFHDTGYVFQYSKNESIGQQIASEYLKLYNFSQKDIERVKNIIHATIVDFKKGYPIQNPDKEDILQKIMCDADLVNIGHKDFFEQTENLIMEMEANGKQIDKKSWWSSQYKFLINHKYFTISAKKKLFIQKQKNLSKIIQKL
ncbi:MAG: HD domain-containing protein [Candidatus Cloacimonadota bacterium]|nr:HD domain-containing protein [Candidatus Cloacimonadota bacterium]